MDLNDLGNTFQSAYKAEHSMETVLLCIHNEIHMSLSKGMHTAMVLLDLQLLLTPLTMTDFSPVSQQGLASPELSKSGLQHFSWIAFNQSKLN